MITLNWFLFGLLFIGAYWVGRRHGASSSNKTSSSFFEVTFYPPTEKDE